MSFEDTSTSSLNIRSDSGDVVFAEWSRTSAAVCHKNHLEGNSRSATTGARSASPDVSLFNTAFNTPDRMDIGFEVSSPVWKSIWRYSPAFAKSNTLNEISAPRNFASSDEGLTSNASRIFANAFANSPLIRFK